MRECAETTDARRGSPAGDTSPTRHGYRPKAERMNADNYTSKNHPDQRTSGRSADNSGTQESEVENATQMALFAVSNGQTESIEIPPDKRIKWNTQDGFTGILPSDRMRWRKAFPRVKLNVELRIMHEWLLARPRRRKKNNFRFISGWLARCQELGGSSGFGSSTCSGVYKARPMSKEEIEAATRANETPGGNCDAVDAFLKDLRRGEL